MQIYRIIGYKLDYRPGDELPSKLYEDLSERHVSDEEVATKYGNYLAAKGLFFDKDEITVSDTIDIESMLVEDAKKKLSQTELDALKNEILNS